MRTGEVQFFQTRDVHQARLGADGRVIDRHILVIGPGRTHAVPVLELRAQGPMPIGECRSAPAECHVLVS